MEQTKLTKTDLDNLIFILEKSMQDEPNEHDFNIDYELCKKLKKIKEELQ